MDISIMYGEWWTTIREKSRKFVYTNEWMNKRANGMDQTNERTNEWMDVQASKILQIKYKYIFIFHSMKIYPFCLND